MTDAKQLLSKNSSGAGISFEEEISERLIEASSNVPQMILYNGSWVSANRGEVREITKTLWNEKLEAGVKLVINTDSHHQDQLRYMEFGIAQARRGWAEKKNIINTQPLEKLLKLLK